MSKTTVLDEIPVMMATASGSPAEAGPIAFERLEAALPSLRSRKFFGFYDPVRDEYRACVALRAEDDPKVLGLEVGVIPGGPYVRRRLHGEPGQIYPQIGPTFEEMASSTTPDEGRPWIEFYRRRDDVVLMLPVLDHG